MQTDRTTTTPELPDDPRDCCRAALRTLGDDFEDAETLVQDVLAVAWASLDSDDIEPRRLRGLIARAEDAYREVVSSVAQVRRLVRHGTTDCREIDAETAEIARAREEGREPPYPVKLMTRVLEMEAERHESEGVKEPCDAA